MKTLLVLRHAKSSWDDSSLRDHDRPLNPRGVRDAPRMGKLIASEDLVPDAIISSTARRALATAELAAGAMPDAPEIETTRDLYMASPHSYLDVLADHAGAVDRVMVVGHNPGITALVTRLTGQLEEMPTAALAVIELDIDDWADIHGAKRGRLAGFWRPKELG
ncbi:MAG: histidine phosphatase family protein [Gemmatimonadota bacterium]|nr:histidine phosphatase family protein [Gemmatimonadota bacterium]